MNKRVPYGRHDIRASDIRAVMEVLESDFLTQGPVVERFEAAVSERCHSLHAVAVNSATSALHLACLALGLGPGDWLWTTPITFVASANCGLYCGAQVDFVDVDAHSGNLDVQALQDKLAAAEKAGRLPKVLVVVHLCGLPCDMDEIAVLCERYGVRIIEDASHAIGASYKGEPVGAGNRSDITVFSFHPVKIITTTEGGMVVTRHPELARKVAMLRSHGITRDASLMTHEPDGPWYYQQLELGFNYRMTEIAAALGLSQLDRLQEYVDSRNAQAALYDRDLQGLGLRLPQVPADRVSARHLYVVQIEDTNRISRRRLFEHLLARGFGINVHYIPVHLQPYYRRMGFGPGQFAAAERYYECSLTIPLFPRLQDEDRLRVVEALREALA
jgi:UDP-4-amino-4,6-dideoxy-N-acetyl-beta-L-altrosamine transaminase